MHLSGSEEFIVRRRLTVLSHLKVFLQRFTRKNRKGSNKNKGTVPAYVRVPKCR